MSLYVVATPIGNLKDITLRALDVLGTVDVILSENVRKTRNLLKHYGIKTKVLSYREGNARRMIPTVIDLIEAGSAVAVVAEAGTPGVSDPGRRLVSAARRVGIRVIPVPGASAVTAAVSVSGGDEPRYVFEGFLPRRTAKRKQRLRELASDSRQLVFFEAPHRLLKTLIDMKTILGDRRCLIGREMTKIHEEMARGRISEFIDLYGRQPARGEFVIVCEGSAVVGHAVSPEIASKEARALVRKGAKRKDAARTVAQRYGLRTREVYKLIAGDHFEGGDSDGR
jgi:16S rRNA (cytidine1402-2'-O)-methyltransferase